MIGDYFALLGLPQRILLDESELKERYHAAAAASRENAEAVNRAYAILKEPAQRIGHLLALHGRRDVSHNQPGASLFSLFFDVSNELKKSDETIASLKSAPSALQRAALIDPVLVLLGDLGKTVDLVLTTQNRHLDELGEIDVAFPELEEAQWKRLAEIGSDLVFLAKWKSEVRKRLTQMQEMLHGAMS